jgi:hypothetical protein
MALIVLWPYHVLPFIHRALPIGFATQFFGEWNGLPKAALATLKEDGTVIEQENGGKSRVLTNGQTAEQSYEVLSA